MVLELIREIGKQARNGFTLNLAPLRLEPGDTCSCLGGIEIAVQAAADLAEAEREVLNSSQLRSISGRATVRSRKRLIIEVRIPGISPTPRGPMQIAGCLFPG